MNTKKAANAAFFSIWRLRKVFYNFALVVKEGKKIRFMILGLALALLLPMGFSLHHALVQHENQICQAEGEQHLHEYHLSCDHDHYFNTSQALEPKAGYDFLNLVFPYTVSDLGCGLDDAPELLPFNGRAPPCPTASC